MTLATLNSCEISLFCRFTAAMSTLNCFGILDKKKTSQHASGRLIIMLRFPVRLVDV